jgi:hypothetical protein
MHPSTGGEATLVKVYSDVAGRSPRLGRRLGMQQAAVDPGTVAVGHHFALVSGRSGRLGGGLGGADPLRVDEQKCRADLLHPGRQRADRQIPVPLKGCGVGHVRV